MSQSEISPDARLGRKQTADALSAAGYPIAEELLPLRPVAAVVRCFPSLARVSFIDGAMLLSGRNGVSAVQ